MYGCRYLGDKNEKRYNCTVENKHGWPPSLLIFGLFNRLDLTEIRRPLRINAIEYNTKPN